VGTHLNSGTDRDRTGTSERGRKRRAPGAGHVLDSGPAAGAVLCE